MSDHLISTRILSRQEEECSAEMSCSSNFSLQESEKANFVNTSDIFPWFISRLRIFLYLSNPYEESYHFEDQVPDYHTEIFPFLISFVLLEWLVRRLMAKPIPLLGDTIASASMTILMECFRIFTKGLEHGIYIYVYRHFHLLDLQWNSPFTFYVSAIVIDFFSYVGHRATHEFHFLWVHHQAHHGSETYSLVNTFRLPFIQDWLYSIWYIPAALIIPPSHYLAHQQINLIYQFWLHTEVIAKLPRPLEWIFNTPSHHRVHHGSNKFCLDKNYGAWLIIWDRMFGTFQEEKEDEEIVYGLVEQVNSFNPLYLQTFYIRNLYDKWCSNEGWKNKLSSIVKGPGWKAGSPWTGNIEEVPDIKSRDPYTYPEKSLFWSSYMLGHFFLILIAYQIVSLYKQRIGTIGIVSHLAFVIFSLTNIGFFYDNHSIAPIFEFIRCSFVYYYSRGGIPLLENSVSWSGITLIYDNLEIIHILIRSIYLFSALTWGLVIIKKTFKHLIRMNFSKID